MQQGPSVEFRHTFEMHLACRYEWPRAGRSMAWARIGHNQPEQAGLSRSQPENMKTALHRVYAGEAPSSWLVCESPLTESNRRPSPYHGDALPTELRGPGGPGLGVLPG